MFESVVANILNRVLGSFVEDFDSKQLNIGIWGGDVKLRNLRLRKESIEKYNLPLEVKFGYLGELTLQIPWSNLKSKPVKITVEDVYLYVEPLVRTEYDEEEEAAKELRLKMERLQNLEEVQSLSDSGKELAEGSGSKESFTTSLVTKVVDNLQINIKNVHFRYEDSSSLTGGLHSFGVKLSELSAVSTNASWEPTFVSETQTFTYKLLKLGSLSCYLNTDTETIFSDDLDDFVMSFKKTMRDDCAILDVFQYLLKPISGEGRLTMNKKGATDSFPHVRADFSFEEFVFDLDSKQYKEILYTASRFHWYMKTYKFRRFRPSVSVSESPISWFKYVAQSILNEVHEKNYKWTWECMAKRRDQRKQYVRLWKFKLLNKISSPQLAELEELDKELKFEDIKFYRSLAKHELRKEQTGMQLISIVPNQKAPKNEGWFSSFWGGSSRATEADQSGKSDSILDINLTEDEKRAFYDTIEYDENKNLINSIDIPKDRVTIQVNALLKKGGVSVIRERGEKNLADVVFEGCNAQYYQRTDSFLANFQLDEFRVEDGTKESLYKHIVSVKQVKSNSNSTSGVQEPFFKLSFEKNPYDEDIDSRLLAKLKSMSIFHNASFISEIYKFFRPPKMHLDTIGAIVNAAEATVEGFTTQTRLGLQYALEEHKTIDVKLDLQAPLIIVPLDPSSSISPVAILDAGHISVVSNLAERSTYSEIRDKEHYTEEDWKKLNSVMYDQFFLNLQDAQFLVGPDIKQTMLQLHSRCDKSSESTLVLDRLNLSLLLGISIVPDAVGLAKFKVSGEVPTIDVSINDFQYKTLMKIIDCAMPRFEEEHSENSSLFSAYNSNQDNLEIPNFNEDESWYLDTSQTHKSQSKEVSSDQHICEFDFMVQSANIELSRSISAVAYNMEPLAKLVCEGLDMKLILTSKCMGLDMQLEDLTLHDYIEKSGVPEFQTLLSSNNFSGDSQASKKPLLNLKYKRAQRLVEFNHKEIEIYDQDIKVDFATMKVIGTRTTILSLLNFILNTFTDPSAPPTDADDLKHNDADNEFAPQKINVDVNLESIILVLNEDGIKLATLQMSSAIIKVFLVPEEMEVTGRIEGLSLHDDVNQGSARDSILRQLVSIDDDTLAEFRYKTLDKEVSKDLYDSILEFKTGSTSINFIESSWARIFNYLSQFQRMKSIYDSARDAAINRASEIEENSRIKFDILVQAPKILFPKLVSDSSTNYDSVTLRLGEIFASNSFLLDEIGIKNQIRAGIRNIGLNSLFHFKEIKQSSNILENLDISFDIDYMKDFVPTRPFFDISGNLSGCDVRLSELQLAYLIEMMNSLTKVLNAPQPPAHFDEIELDAEHANAAAMSGRISPYMETENKEIMHEEQCIPSDYVRLRFHFSFPGISLSLYNGTENLCDFGSKKISRFAINEFNFSIELRQDSHFSSDLKVKSFVVEDVRKVGENRFREIIPRSNSNDDQFRLNISSNGQDGKRYTTCILNVESPKCILALDYIFELVSFLNASKNSAIGIEDLEDADEDFSSNDSRVEGSSATSNIKKSEDEKDETSDVPGLANFGFSVNIKDCSVYLLADSTRLDTEAVVFKVEQMLLTSQNIHSIAANNVGMFLTLMNSVEDKNLRIIDDFSVSFAYDPRGSDATHYMAKVSASVDRIIMRLSLRDTRLAFAILNNAKELYNKSQSRSGQRGTDNSYSEEFRTKLSKYAPSIISKLSSRKIMSKLSDSKEDSWVTKEDLNASFGGLRFVFISDIHELPVLDFNVKPFEAKAINWSSDLSAESHVEFFLNVFNYSRSTWEPMIECLPLSLYISRSTTPKLTTMVEIFSRKLSEVTVSSRSIATLSQIFSLITADQELRERGNDYPYLIKNETGYDAWIWVDRGGAKDKKTLIKKNQSLPWSFQDWREIRENLDSDCSLDVLGIELIGSSYIPLEGIPVDGEGDNITSLNPPIDGVHSRLSCEIKLQEDLVKHVWLKSTIKFQNDSDVPIQVHLAQNKGGEEFCLDIEPSSQASVPIDYVYNSRFAVRPKTETEFLWSKESLYWKDPQISSYPLTCCSPTDKNMIFNFHSSCVMVNEPLAKIYPHLTYVISAPVEIINLLPYDFDYRLYDKTSKKDWKGTISKGEKSYIHVVNLQSLLLLSVQPRETGFKRSDFAIINALKDRDFKREDEMSLTHENGQRVKLRLHYMKHKSNAASLTVAIFSPYVLINKTCQNIIVNQRGNSLYLKGNHAFNFTPAIFSYDNFFDRSNRAILKVGDSVWSQPISFEAIGSSQSINTQLSARQAEVMIGVTVTEGEGMYNLTKVVEISPRFVIKNCTEDSLELVENGSTQISVINPEEIHPLYVLRKASRRTLLLKFINSRNWSSPFCIEETGQIFLKVYKDNHGQKLFKISIILDKATIFVQIDDAGSDWPFSIRNFSGSEFYIYQGDPTIDQNGDIVRNDVDYKPIYYKIPPRSSMPYAYDFPDAVIKELIIRSHGRERVVNLSEIGNLRPFRLPATKSLEQKIVDLNVVADGPNQSLVISDYDPSKSLYKLKKVETNTSQATNTGSTSHVNFLAEEEDDNYHTKIVTNFEGFGFSLINDKCQELCYITLRGIELRYNESDLYQNLSLKLKWIQIDNQLFGGIFPIILYPTMIPKSAKEMNQHPSFSAAICRVKDDAHGVLFFKYATMLFQEMTFEMDEDFLFALLDFSRFPGASWNKKNVDRLCDDTMQIVVPPKMSSSNDLYFEALHLQPTSLNISFVRTERVNAEDKSSSENALMFFFNVLTMAIGNINDAPIRLNALFIENIRTPLPLLVELVETHYGQAFFYQVHKILGSADFLGNPVGLFNNLSSGVLDIFYEPYQGFILNDRPQELGIGIAKGGLSFLKKSIFGFSDSVAKVTGSIAKGLSVVTLDEKFQQRRRLNQRRNKPSHALYGFANGANSFFESFSSGVSGLAISPLEGANKEGTSGFFRGIGKGLVGLPTKTAIGFFDLATNVSEGIRNTTTVFDAEGLDKVRLPRYIGYDKVIRPFDQRESQGQYWLKSIDGELYFDEVYLAHLILPGEQHAVLVTFNAIIMFETNTLKSTWVVPLDEIKSISNEVTGICINLKKKEGPFIPIADKSNRNFLYNKIGVAVTEFNKHCQVVL